MRTAAIVWPALFTGWVVAQTSQSQVPVFRGRVDLVPLDVSVWDAQHRSVKDLDAHQFTLLEDGKPRPIVTFAAVDIPPSDPPSAQWMTNARHDVEANDIVDKRLFLIL